MIAPLLLVLATPPETVRIATPRGQTSIPVSRERGAAIAAPIVAGPLELAIVIEGARAVVVLDGVGFVFALGSPYARIGTRMCQLVDEAYVARDTLFLPLVWLTDCVPRIFAGRFHWDAALSVLTEIPRPGAPAQVAARVDSTPVPVDLRLPPVVDSTVAPAAPPVTRTVTRSAAPNPITGLRQRHVVVVDPGHGGRDPGNPGRYFPRGVTEKDVNLGIGRLLRTELARRGIVTSLTRTSDTLIDLHDRAGYCRDDCELFISVHVNSMPSGRRTSVADGVETYFLSDAKTEDQRRVARMENDAIRFESVDAQAVEGDLATIVKDLQQNEYLRESARLAELVQQRVAGVHPGTDRGVQQAGFYVLNSARRPAILVETGFATNKRDGAFLASPAGQRKIAHAIADGIVGYFLELEHKLALGGPP
ncbi:MAG TPA: N-acetylmuramoyl-L-alanine amidase [Gemmatimonadales bacterium]|nr:N-acetylmuramoyl-L-alanine amidase [Gemmatimonadales bacterium]